MKQNLNFPIDFIISWVDQDDPMWQKKFNHYSDKSHDSDSEVRYRDYGTLRYVFRSIEKYAPWVRKVFFVTDHQWPKWLNKENEKLVLVDHTDYIDSKYLPTFNSNVIELNYFRIADLAEHFVCFNDDTLLNKPVKPEDFFDVNGNPRDSLCFNAIMPYSIFDHVHVNNISIINQEFSKKKQMPKIFTKLFSPKNFEWNIFSFLLLPWPKFTRFFDPHTQVSYRKSNFVKVFQKYPQILNHTNNQKFRSTEDYSIWVLRYFQLVSGQFSTRSAHFGKNYDMKNTTAFLKDLTQKKHHLLNINDAHFEDVKEYNEMAEKVERGLKEEFSQKSSFEIKEM